MSDIRKQIMTPCARMISQEGDVTVNYGDFVERLILFDKYIVHSHRLEEIPHLIRHFGYDAVLELLRNGSTEIHNDVMMIGSFKQGEVRVKDRFNFRAWRFKYEESQQMDLARITPKLHMNGENETQLLKALTDSLVRYPEGSEDILEDQFKADLRANSSSLQKALQIKLSDKLGHDVQIEGLNLNIEIDDEGNTRTESNLETLYGLSVEEAHQVLEGAILAIGGLNERILQMRSHTALTGFGESEIPVFESKLQFLESQLSPTNQKKRFQRVLSFSEFPDLSEAAIAKKVDLLKLLEIRQSPEIAEFRNWLWSADSFTDEEIKKRIGGFKNTLSRAVHSKWGKGIRWLATTALGVVEPISATGVGVLDSFLVDKVLPESGVSTFIGSQYPSIFQK